MSTASFQSLASTQDDDVASIEWGVSTAASYNTDDEVALLGWSALTPPAAYEDDVSEKSPALAHSPQTPPHYADDEEVEVARRDVKRLSIGEEFTARVHELLHESKAALKADRMHDSGDEKEPRVDSEEEGVSTAREIGCPPLPFGGGASSRGRVARGGAVRPTRGMRMGMGHPPPPPPFFAPPHNHRYGAFAPPPFGPLGYDGPSMRPFNSLFPPHFSAGGLGRPMLPPRPYMGGAGGYMGGLGAGGRGGMAQGGPLRGLYQQYYAGHHPPSPYPHGQLHHHHYSNHHQQQLQHSLSPPSSVGTPRRDSESSPRSSAISTSSASPRTAPVSVERPKGRISQSALERRPATMASLGVGRAASMMPAASSLAAGAELTPYPLVYVSPAGSISCVLDHDVVVEVAVDRSVRLVLHDSFAAFCNSRGTSSAILHSTARIVHTEDHVHSKFIANNEKMAVFGEHGVLFTMSHLSEAYLVNSAAYPGAASVPLDQLQFPSMDDDFTIKMFYTEAQTGQQFIGLCKDIVSDATYDRRPDGSLYLHINGLLIRQSPSGDVIVDARPRQISCSPSKKSIHVRSSCIEMAVEAEERGYVKQALKRVHVSRSGMVISDGNCITSMDHFGRIVCCN